VNSPNTDAESLVAQVWADVLSLPISSIGTEDIFIQLGGSSIQATGCLLKLKETLPNSLEISLLLEPLTLREFAVFLETSHVLHMQQDILNA